jgi:predicted DNA-binding transcriptional regulator YafY
VSADGEDGCLLEIGADDVGWLARFLLNLPFEFRVEGPAELRAELASIGRSLASSYSREARE